MYSLFRRFAHDATSGGMLVVGLGFLSLVITTVTTYLAIFANEYVLTTPLVDNGSLKEAAFLRVIDSRASMITQIESPELELNEGSPGLYFLVNLMESENRLTIRGSVDEFNEASGSEFADPRALLIVGAERTESGFDIQQGVITLSLGKKGNPDATSQKNIHRIPLVPSKESKGVTSYIQGTGHVIPVQGRSVYAMTPEVFGSIYDSRALDPVDFVSAVTCNCSVPELQEIADKMTQVERAAGTGRVYYALSYEGVRGDQSFHRVSSSVWILTFGVSIVAIFAATIVQMGRRMWSHQELSFRIDRLNGASHGALQLRFHVQILFAFTLPAIGGFLLVNIGVGSTGFPPSFSEIATRVIIAGLLAVHLIASLPATVAIRRMCNYSHGILR